MRDFWVYMMANKSRTTLYTGVTNNLLRRVFEHKSKTMKGFTKRYNLTALVYFEQFPDIRDAIGREKQIKTWRRARKNELVETENPRWSDLSEGWYE